MGRIVTIYDLIAEIHKQADAYQSTAPDTRPPIEALLRTVMELEVLTEDRSGVPFPDRVLAAFIPAALSARYDTDEIRVYLDGVAAIADVQWGADNPSEDFDLEDHY